MAAAIVALLAALSYAVGSVAQQKAAAEVPTGEATGTRLLLRLVRRPLWVVGVMGDALGYAGQAVALGLGSLVLVQPLLVTSLLFALPLSAVWAGRRLRPSDGAWALLLTAGLAAFVVVGDPSGGRDTAPLGSWLATAAVLGPVVVGCLIGAQLSASARAVLLAVATGILFGVAAALTKSTISVLGDGVGELLASWELYALVVAGAGGFLTQAEAFQAGSLQASLPVMTVLDPVVAGLLGVTILHEDVKATGAEWAVIVVAVAVMTGATVALARGAAALEPHVGGPSRP